MGKILGNATVLMILLVSGGLRFSGEHLKACSVLFFLMSLFTLIRKKTNKVLYVNLILGCSVAGWIYITSKITAVGADNTYFSYVLLILGSCFLVSAFRFDEFKEVFLCWLNRLAVVSILVQTFFWIGILPGKTSVVANMTRTMSLYFFQTVWGYKDRLSSIYWEPGQFQIVLIFGLCLFLKEISVLSDLKKNVKRFAPVFLSLFLTFSTTGYLCLGVFCIAVSLSVKLTGRKRIFAPVLLLVGTSILTVIANTEVVQNKFSDDSVSYNIRLQDNLACWRITSENPVFGVGMGTNRLKTLRELYDSKTSSNGWLNTSSTSGIPLILLLWICMFCRIKERGANALATIVLLVTLIVSQANEYQPLYPYLFIYVYKFKDGLSRTV